jgi:ribosomal protein S18 acetylase RimI-like enzyme
MAEGRYPADAGQMADTRVDDLRIEAHPRREDLEELHERLYRFNVASLGGTEGDELAIFVRDADGSLLGGIAGFTWLGWMQVNVLWVREDQRGRGLGSRLLAAAEAEGRARGAHTCLLETHTFQAPDFYPKYGYEVYATIEAYPPGHSKLLFRKRLSAEDA